ncbi:hypothetical protein AN960_12475 [Bacillus sp. FJAT-25509]|nr:hypothetical protein AN960_12475 [Bacillus sp. FJAT-25509]
MGNAGRLRAHRNERDEEAQVSPHGKRASRSGNQPHSTPFTKIWLFNYNFVFQQPEQSIKGLLF